MTTSNKTMKSILTILMLIILLTTPTVAKSDNNSNSSMENHITTIKAGEMSPMEALVLLRKEEQKKSNKNLSKEDREQAKSKQQLEQEFNRTNTNVAVIGKVFFKEYISLTQPLPIIHLTSFYKDMLLIEGNTDIMNQCLEQQINKTDKKPVFRACLYNEASPKQQKKYNETISSMKNGVQTMAKHNMNLIDIPFVEELIR